jgi:hypothetical protein
MVNLNHTQIIQMFIDKYNYKSYLEIGIELAINYNSIICNYKVGIDPKPECKFLAQNILTMTSDEYFEMNNKVGEKYDIIFVDGLHTREQLIKDIYNAMYILNPNGTIIVHDCNPENEDQQKVPRENRTVWTGDVWKGWLHFRLTTIDYKMYVIDCDYGVGVIQRDNFKLNWRHNEENIEYKNFQANKKEWLNLTDKVFLED